MTIRAEQPSRSDVDVCNVTLRPNFQVHLPSRELRMSGRTLIMGVLNVTPDSFYDGGRYFKLNKAIDRGLQLEQQGADILDVGGESTHPRSRAVPAAEEI